ncbi:ethanolamine ammonia-lyase reactivating factor EutA [Endozoicomonas atrinae]|uniref:ethanolamine ammonia-lyase reactivating factor EutA n=1 Tax=Endozoicomonas atrinae TaxID=1333660 RepID=UPI000826D94A|nr:ethanolamine ammonia-lyase reactivating factor EutA [Endozoicomonas atrinae]
MFRHFTGNQSVMMIGLDFGSTTSRAMIASAHLERNPMTERMELGEPELIYRSDAILTPFENGELCTETINTCLEQWLEESGIDCDQLFSGGVIITGLAAEKQNALAIARSVREKVNQAIVATADDPCMESWLAFMGNSLELSRATPEIPFINLDIGGGTTNPALGIDGNITESGCYYIGARHFQFEPGTYRLLEVSNHGQQLLVQLGLQLTIGEECSQNSIDKIVSFYVQGLEAMVTGDHSWFDQGDGQQLCQVAFQPNAQALQQAAITFSGGVGELLYQYTATGKLPDTTAFGDLGIDLCKAIADSKTLCRSLSQYIPEYKGRATVYGLALHSAELSGNTLFMPKPEQLPVNDLPIVARLALNADENRIKRAIELARKTHNGGCIRITLRDDNYPGFKELKSFGEKLAEMIELSGFPSELPLLLLVPKDFGKVIGSYASRWGKLPVNLMAVDEVPDRKAGFVSLGKVKNFVIPVYFYGMH